MQTKEILLLILAVLLLSIVVLQLILSLKKRAILGPLTFILMMIGYLFALFLTYRGNELESKDWAQMILTIGLVAVTAVYAFATEKIAKATKEQAEAGIKMAEEMREQRYTESLPILIPTIKTTINCEINEIPYVSLQTGREIEIIWHNLGKGIAIDAIFSLYCAPYNSEKANLIKSKEKMTVAVQQEVIFNFQTSNKVEQILKDDYVPRLIAEYKDIYKRQINTVQEFRIIEENGEKRAFIGEQYFIVNGKRLGVE